MNLLWRQQHMIRATSYDIFPRDPYDTCQFAAFFWGVGGGASFFSFLFSHLFTSHAVKRPENNHCKIPIIKKQTNTDLSGSGRQHYMTIFWYDFYWQSKDWGLTIYISGKTCRCPWNRWALCHEWCLFNRKADGKFDINDVRHGMGGVGGWVGGWGGWWGEGEYTESILQMSPTPQQLLPRKYSAVSV